MLICEALGPGSSRGFRGSILLFGFLSKHALCRFDGTAPSIPFLVMTCIPFCNVFDVYLCKPLKHVPLTTSYSLIDALEQFILPQGSNDIINMPLIESSEISFS